MRVAHIVKQFINEVTPCMHKVRRQSLQASISSLMSGADLSVTSLGRHIQSQTSEKHQIKRSMRLCSNPHLHQEIDTVYAMTTRRLIAQQARPIILVDWSNLDTRKQHFLLRASLAVKGRSLTLLEQVYGNDEKEKPAIHKHFMTRLKNVLPDGCHPIIVTDAGFRVPWFRLVEALGFDYVGRVRNRTLCRQEVEPWLPIKRLYTKANTRPKDLGLFQLCRNKPIACKMVVYKQKRLGRKHLNATGDKARLSALSRKHAGREKEPWLLATSLQNGHGFAKKIIKIYHSRMQIEESFRDLKTGLGFAVSQTRQLLQLSVLLMIAMLTQAILFLIGLAIEASGKQRQYQANTVKDRPVLSYQYLGLRAVRDKWLSITKLQWQAALLKLSEFSQEHHNV
jgi:DDE family transposase